MSRRAFLVSSAAAVAATGMAGACASPAATAPSEPSAAPEEGIAIEPGPEPGPGRAARENLLDGTDRWQLPLDGTGGAEGYFGDVSAQAGDELTLHVRSASRAVSVFVYRLGWYGGAGGRLVGRWTHLAVGDQPPPVTDASTGEIACAWSATLRFTVPVGWVSGAYLAVLRPDAGEPQWATFLVRESSVQAPILFVSAMTTEQAYNAWGGRSLYADNSTGAPTVAGSPRAVKVSFDRPYERDRGAGYLMRWELPMIRWQEAHAYDLGYCADLDLGRYPHLVTGRRLIVFAGHPEYWSRAMRSTVESAVAAGTNVAFLSGNELYWRVRLEAGATGPARTLVCYRDARTDPLAAADPADATTAWGDPPDPRPAGLLVGLSYGHVCQRSADLVVTSPGHWLFDGTGLRAGDRIANLVGPEYDTFDPDPGHRPPGAQVLCASPVRPLSGQIDPGSSAAPGASAVQNSGLYVAPSGATVFAAGTMTWAWGLDDWGDHTYQGVATTVDPRVGRMTANLLDRLGA